MPKKLRTIKVDDADWEQWQLQSAEAGLSLSEWIRRRCNEAPTLYDAKRREIRETTRRHIRNQVLESRSGTQGVPVEARESRSHQSPSSPRGTAKVCAHGTPRGYHCWQCGGLAVIAVLLLFLALPSYAAPDAPVAKEHAPAHRFYDRWGKVELGAALTVASADSAITCHNLVNGGQEHWQPSQSCAGNVGILFGGVAAQEGAAFLLHKAGWHKPERLIRFFTIQASSRAIAYSAKHGGV